ncbi:hypothetical protein ABT237_15960 [Streptomyces sp. NPDC001581]|uniref:hypothetical protein n=1 Tax=Streptomyces sp. NPDC001581 TaxID=3154386 RepID=UPI003324AB08
MDDNPWFWDEDLEQDGSGPGDLTADELAFLKALRAHAGSWTVPWTYSSVARPEDESSLLLHVDLSDNLILGQWAVHFYGTHVQAGWVCDQLFNLEETPEGGFFEATGTIEELAERCAAWFETVLSRPVSREQWLHKGRVYATGWAFADTGEPLVRSVDNTWAPTPYWGWHSFPGEPHDRCTLVRGATQPQTGPHAPSCPYEPAPGSATDQRVRPEPTPHRSRTTSWRRRFPFGSHHRT